MLTLKWMSYTKIITFHQNERFPMKGMVSTNKNGFHWKVCLLLKGMVLAKGTISTGNGFHWKESLSPKLLISTCFLIKTSFCCQIILFRNWQLWSVIFAAQKSLLKTKNKSFFQESISMVKRILSISFT